jgi:hypothetical protein
MRFSPPGILGLVHGEIRGEILEKILDLVFLSRHAKYDSEKWRQRLAHNR